jgi:hypothetical protein
MAKKKPTSRKTSNARKAAPKKKPSPKRKPAGGHVVSRAFTALVTRLRDAWLDSPKKLAPDFVDDEALEWAREFEALPLGVVDHLCLFLHPEGRVLAYHLFFEEVTAEFDKEHELDHGLRVGSKHFPELKSLLSPRPLKARDCDVCEGMGWFGEGKNWVACNICWGRGWLPPGLGELTERTANSLRPAGEDSEAVAAVVRRFLDHGLALGLCASVLCQAFGWAVSLADSNDAQREQRFRICGAVGREHFPGGWPYWAE